MHVIRFAGVDVLLATKAHNQEFSVLLLIPINQLVCFFGSVYRPHKPDLLICEVLLLTPKARPQTSYKKL